MPLRRLITLIITTHSPQPKSRQMAVSDNEKTRQSFNLPDRRLHSKLVLWVEVRRRTLTCMRAPLRTGEADLSSWPEPFSPISRLRRHRANSFFTM